MRASYTQSRCAVGLDCGSRKIEDLIEYLRGYRYYYDADAVKMDKSWTPALWDAVISLAKRLTEFSAGAVMARKLELLLFALKDAIIEIKGDLMVLFWNPSGNDITVELNSLAVCIIIESVNRLLMVVVAWITYGDDMVLATDRKLPDNYAATFTQISGIGLTDGAKRAVLRELPFEEISFLKRHFRFELENGCWMAPLDESSIVKMLLYREKSSLSPSDHEVALVEAALRYALLHGRAKYGAWVDLLTSLPLGKYVAVPDFDEFLVSYAGGGFSDWTDRQALHEGQRFVRQSKRVINMSDLSMTTPASEQMPPTTTASLGEDHTTSMVGGDATADAATVNISGAMTTIAIPRAFSAYQEPASYALSDFLTRWTDVARITLSNTDQAMTNTSSSVVATFSPVINFFTNTRVLDKTENFSFYRGDMEVLFVTAVPGNASGAYVVSAIPALSSDTSTFGGFKQEQCMNVDNYVYLSMEASTSISMSLPYWSVADMSPVGANAAQYGSWQVYITCLSPLRTAIPGGVTTGSITVYARLKPNYKLMVPKWQGARYQGKRAAALMSHVQAAQQSKVLSSTTGKIAGAAHMLADVPVIGGIAGAVAGIADTATSVLSFFGFSRENEQPRGQHFANRTVTNVALGAGMDAADVAGFMPDNAISIDTNITGAGVEDPMAFESVAGRWTAIANTSWSASQSSQTVLLEVPITPGYGYGDLNTMKPTGAGYVGLPFEYWRADAEIRIVVPGSTLHRGALQAVYVPTTIGPTSVDDVTSVSMNAIMDVSAGTVFDYTVGFSRELPMLPLRYWNDGFVIVPITTANGSLQLRVLNPLVSQNPTDTLNIVVFIRFTNVQFAVPRTTLQWPNATDLALLDLNWEDAITLQGKRYQGNAPGDDGAAVSPICADLVPAPGIYAVEDVVAGESVGSLRVLAQRPSRLIMEDGDSALIGFGGMYGSANFSPRLTTAGLAGGLFTAMAASERIRVFSRESNAWIGVSHLTTAQLVVGSSFQTYVPAHMPMTFVGGQRGAEFALPYYAPWRMRTTRRREVFPNSGASADTAIRSAERMALIHPVGVTRLEAYYSFGNDIRPGPYMCVPRWTMARTKVLTPWFPAA